MRTIVYGLVKADVTLQAETPRWYESGSVEDAPALPFGILHYGPRVGLHPGAQDRTLRISVYDDKGSYDRIDRIIGHLERVLLPQIDVTQGDSRLTSVTWIQSSGDLDSPEYRANMRYVEFRIAGR